MFGTDEVLGIFLLWVEKQFTVWFWSLIFYPEFLNSDVRFYLYLLCTEVFLIGFLEGAPHLSTQVFFLTHVPTIALLFIPIR